MVNKDSTVRAQPSLSCLPYGFPPQDPNNEMHQLWFLQCKMCALPALYINIYYHTPLPLNLANKQATTSNKQALLLSVLAIALSHRSGLYSTLAILQPRWWPCQIQVLSQKLTSGAPGRWRQVGRCPPKTARFLPQNSLFFAQNRPETQSKRTKEGKRGLHSRAP